ncbi:MAG: peptidylprolyl isomerase [Lentisphaerae bacterium GWF2_44_16]|nr:MAG: peptidylprolyl isomerase [Lentisphaerae bacterium GWF2_44_16]
MVTIKTSKGNIELELYADKAPVTVENFLKYVEDGFFNNTIFHRVIDGFMIQGGGMNKNMEEKKTRAPIKNEAHNGLKNKKGTIAMARTSVVDSATSQFFINVKDNSFLDYKSSSPDGYGYCVFGKVTKGMDVIDAIKSVETGSSGYHDDVPVEAIEILEITKG